MKILLIKYPLLFVLCLGLMGCSTTATTETQTEPVEDAVYATTIQRNNRTVRVKNFNQVLADDSKYPTDNYIRFGFFYDCYATPDEITRHEYIRDDSLYTWNDSIQECFSILYSAKFPTKDQIFQRYVIEDYLQNKAVEGYVSGADRQPYDNMYRYTFRVGSANYMAVLTQTVEDLEKGDNVYSLYVGIYSLAEKE